MLLLSATLAALCASTVATPSIADLPLPPAVAPTGRFALQRHDDEGWVLHRPDGAPTFLLALNHLANPFYFDVIEGASGLAPCRPYDANCIENDLFAKRYNNSWAEATSEFVANSKNWGFNSAGYEYVPAPGLSWSYLPDLFLTNASHIFANSADYNASFPDVFEESFNVSVDARVRAWIATDQHINAPRVLKDVVGYYFEDQALWNVSLARNKAATGRDDPMDFAQAIRMLGPHSAGKHAYVAFLEERYESRGGLPSCRQSYGIPSSIHSYDLLLDYDFGDVQLLSAAVVADDTEFLGVIAERYFSVAAAAVRRHDPAALVFGQRFIGQDIVDTVMVAAGRYFDVISVQPSPFSFDDSEEAADSASELARISALSGGRPVFVADQTTHFDGVFGGLRPSCWVDEGGSLHGCAANATGAGVLYAKYLAELRQRPEIIGYSHCQYINRAVCPRSADAKRTQECSGTDATNVHLKQGLLNWNGNPQTEYAALVTAANKKYGF